MSSREVIRRLENGGWVLIAGKGSHHQSPFTRRNPHGEALSGAPIPIGTLRSIEKHSGVMLR